MNRREFIGTLPVSTPAAAAAADEQRPTGLVLTHLLAQIDQPGIREQIVHEIQQVFDGKVIWGEDLMRLGLSGSRVSTIEPGQHE